MHAGLVLCLTALANVATVASIRLNPTQSIHLTNPRNDVKATFTHTVATAYLQEGEVVAKFGDANRTASIAWGSLTPNDAGWHQLYISISNVSATSATQAQKSYSIGYLEGVLTCELINDMWHNFYGSFWPGESSPSAELLAFITENDAWVQAQAAARAPTDDHWQAVQDVLDQFAGLVAGYNRQCPQAPLSRTQLLLAQADGDLEDLVIPLQHSRRNAAPPWASPRRVAGHEAGVYQRCSALIKLAPDGSDIFFAHDTWDTFSSAAPRIWKTYTVSVRRQGSEALHTTSFSGTPGWLASMDDYYVTRAEDGTSLVVIETSNSVPDHALYDKLTPKSILCWVRTLVSNRLARGGKEWTAAFSVHHSGTYNNQWMVVDLAKFSPSAAMGAELLWVLEEMPGLVHAEDMSAHLVNASYWASFNVPFFPEVRAYAGYSPSAWRTAPRHCLFEALHKTVTDLDAFKAVMRWNGFRSGELSECTQGSAVNAIMARGDLSPGAASAFGGIDSKVASYRSLREASTVFLNAGPTHSYGLEPFCWGPPFSVVQPHDGAPSCYNYTWTPAPAFVPSRNGVWH